MFVQRQILKIQGGKWCSKWSAKIFSGCTHFFFFNRKKYARIFGGEI